jgi:hypothetical protein
VAGRFHFALLDHARTPSSGYMREIGDIVDALEAWEKSQAKTKESRVATEQEDLTRERMKAQPFTPSGLTKEHRDSRSLEYIAFYLGEIDGKMERIAKALEEIQAGALGFLNLNQSRERPET